MQNKIELSLIYFTIKPIQPLLLFWKLKKNFGCELQGLFKKNKKVKKDEKRLKFGQRKSLSQILN